MATLTIAEFNKKLDAIIKELDEGTALFIASRALQEKMSKRIFKDGKNAIGMRRTYKSAGYRKKRALKGRQTSYVNYVMTGELQSDFNNNLVELSDGSLAITLRQNNLDKTEWVEKDSGVVFELMDSEEKFFKKILEKEIKRLFGFR